MGKSALITPDRLRGKCEARKAAMAIALQPASSPTVSNPQRAQ